jgi:uncharacterized Zn finger protein
MSFWSFRPYVPVAKRRAQAAREVEKLKKKGRVISPVMIEGRKITQSFWGKAWCENLERYSDYENRLPRGRTYVRNGSVVDLRIERGALRALVSGSEIYEVKIDIAVAAPSRWKAICKDCAGSIGSLIELLQGKLSKNVMERVCREGDGLFPAPNEIKMSCSCPDWADMCKHVAATLYGAGARFDAAPDLLFTLRGVDRAELIASAGADLPMTGTAAKSERVLADDDVAGLFGIDMAPPSAPPLAEKRKRKTQPKDEPPAQAAIPASRRGKKTTAPAASREAKEPEKGGAKKASRPVMTTPTRQKKTPPGEKGPGAASTAMKKHSGPKAKKTVEKATFAPEALEAKPNAKSRRFGGAPTGLTRAAKWIGARARKARG